MKLDRPVLTNIIDVSVDGSSVRCTTAIFGGNTLVTTGFSGGGPALAAFVRSRSQPRRAAPRPVRSCRSRCPMSAPQAPRAVLARHVEESTGPKLDEANIVVSGGRGLGEAGNYHLIEDSRSC